MLAVFRIPIVRAVALVTLFAGSAAAGEQYTSYDIRGMRSDVGAPIGGSVNFGSEGSLFTTSQVGNWPALQGNYEELNLLVVSFWSFEGILAPFGPSVTGSGVRLLFGLLIFGSFEHDSVVFSLSGTFDSILAADRGPSPEVGAVFVSTEHFAWRRREETAPLKG